MSHPPRLTNSAAMLMTAGLAKALDPPSSFPSFKKAGVLF